MQRSVCEKSINYNSQNAHFKPKSSASIANWINVFFVSPSRNDFGLYV